jgi:eukaryotic-like serine/threonine-protein kinase
VFGAPFDLRKLTFRSPPAPLFDGVRTLLGGADMALGADGTLIYASGAAGVAGNPYQIVRVDRRGTATVVDTSWAFQPGIDFSFALSPDGRRLALGLNVGGDNDIYVKQLPTGPLTRLTFEGMNERPEWTADGRWIMYAFRKISGDTAQLRERLADGVGAESTLVHLKRGVYMVERTPDPTRLILRLGVPPTRDIVAYTLGTDSAVPLMANDHYQEVAPALSPDGRWLAYASDESGRYEVFVRPYPNVGAGRWQVSANGGTEPEWSRSGRELFFRDASDGFIAAQVLPGPTFALGSQTRLFSAAGYESDDVDRAYAVLPADSAFLFVRPVQAQGARAASSLVLVENWFHELERGGAGRE